MCELIGTWSLQSFKVTSRDGIVRDWQDGGASGLLIYSADGYMSVSINSRVEIFKKESEAKNILDSCLFYSGTYKVENDCIVTHLVTQATNPIRIGEKMVRNYRLDSGVLTISATGEYGSSILVWEKVK